MEDRGMLPADRLPEKKIRDQARLGTFESNSPTERYELDKAGKGACVFLHRLNVAIALR